MSSNAPLKGAIIGAGYFAQFQAEGWTRISGARIVAVADPVPGKARTFSDKYGFARAYESVDEMLKEERPDFVDIATRPESHLELVARASNSGAHIICQKPMAPTWDECIAMCDVCEKAGVRLCIHENWRWQPWYREAKAIIEGGAIGEPFEYSFFWRTGDGRGPEPYMAQPYFRQMPRLLIYETLVHLLDTFRFLGGEMEVRHCRTARLNSCIAGEDQALIVTRFASGALGLIDGNRHTGPAPSPPAMGTCLIEGMEGGLRVAPEGPIHLTRVGAEEERLPFIPPDTGYKGDSVRATQEHLLICLREGKPSESDGRDYLKTVRLVEECYRLAKETPQSWPG